MSKGLRSVAGSLFLLIAITWCTPLSAQNGIETETASTRFYFPQVADGGPPTGRWQTTFRFANPNPASVTATIYLYGNQGEAMQMNFGGGATAQYSFTVPPYGTTTFQNLAPSATTTSGWVFGTSSNSLQGVVTYRLLQNGVAVTEVSVPSTLPTPYFFSPATSVLGIAIANIYSTPTSLVLTARSNTGIQRQGFVTIPPLGHRSMFLNEIVPGLGSSFTGTVEITGANGFPYFAALTLHSDTGALYSSLPSGTAARPSSQFDKIVNIFSRVREAARGYVPNVDTVQLFINSDQILNASGSSSGIQINLALAELIADSDSELAFVIAHEMGHVYQGRTGKREFDPTNAEFDADEWGLFLGLGAGYDPYGSAGALAKLAMATGTAGLVIQFEQQSATDAHKSFNQRLAAVYGTIQSVCSIASIASTCQQYHSLYHPHIPTALLISTTEPRPGPPKIPDYGFSSEPLTAAPGTSTGTIRRER